LSRRFYVNDCLRRRHDGAASARLAATCACLLMLVALVDSQVVAAITPQIAAGLGSAKTSVAASVMVYALAAAAVALVLGRSAGRVDPVRWLPWAAGSSSRRTRSRPSRRTSPSSGRRALWPGSPGAW
jgi:MFS family permease